MTDKQQRVRGSAPFESLLPRVRGEYLEMPGLRMTLVQACRLWQVDAPTCAKLLDLLVSDGFLYKTATGFYIASPDAHRRY
jgi:hypothetical protein